jgi:hypothetical protein
MNPYYGAIVSQLDNKIVLDFLYGRSLTFKNATYNASICKDEDITLIVLAMIKAGKASNFLLKQRLYYDIQWCSVANEHKCPSSQKYFYRIDYGINKNIPYCNNCIDAMVRFSDKMIYCLGKKWYNFLVKRYLLLRLFIYDKVDVDCFKHIFNHLLVVKGIT